MMMMTVHISFHMGVLSRPVVCQGLPHFTPSPRSVNTRHSIQAGLAEGGTFPHFHRDHHLLHQDVALLHVDGVTVLAVLHIFSAALQLTASLHCAQEDQDDDDHW